MLSTSTDLLLVILALCAVALTIFTCVLIYRLSKVVVETGKTVTDVNKKLETIDPTVTQANETVTSLMETVDDINVNLLKPVASVGKVVGRAKRIINIFKGE